MLYPLSHTEPPIISVVGAMEMVAMDMKLRGMYITRQLGLTGVTLEVEEVLLTQGHVRMYDKVVHLGELRGPSSPPWIGPSSCDSSNARGASPTEPTHSRGLSGPTWTDLPGT